jgi:ABC-type Zn uptake system ZnuABC Zn-binding protein ZnuA
MFQWFYRSQFWQRYKLGVLLADIGDKAKIAVQAGCFVYVVREYGVEFTVVRGIAVERNISQSQHSCR